MADTRTVNHTVTGPGGQPLANVQVIADLFFGSGYVNAEDFTIISSQVVETDVNGLASFELVPNDLVIPAETTYRIRDYPRPHVKRTHYICVPTTAGPFWLGDILCDPPTDLPSAPLSAFITGPFADHENWNFAHNLGGTDMFSGPHRRLQFYSEAWMAGEGWLQPSDNPVVIPYPDTGPGSGYYQDGDEVNLLLDHSGNGHHLDTEVTGSFGHGSVIPFGPTYYEVHPTNGVPYLHFRGTRNLDTNFYPTNDKPQFLHGTWGPGEGDNQGISEDHNPTNNYEGPGAGSYYANNISASAVVMCLSLREKITDYNGGGGDGRGRSLIDSGQVNDGQMTLGIGKAGPGEYMEVAGSDIQCQRDGMGGAGLTRALPWDPSVHVITAAWNREEPMWIKVDGKRVSVKAFDDALDYQFFLGSGGLTLATSGAGNYPSGFDLFAIGVWTGPAFALNDLDDMTAYYIRKFGVTPA